MFRNNRLSLFVECLAIIPFLALCLAGYYQYSFYSSLELIWILNQLPVSGILFSAIPLFVQILAGVLAGTIFYILCLSHNEFSKIESFIYFIFILSLIIIMIFVKYGWSINAFKAGWISYSIFIFSFIFSFIFYLNKVIDDYFLKIITLSITVLSLMFIEPIISLQSDKKIKKLFSGDASFSRVYFTDEGNKVLPNTTQVLKMGKIFLKNWIGEFWKYLMIRQL